MLVRVLNKETNLIITKNVHFDKESKLKYISEFEQLKINGVFAKNTNFEDKEWIIRANNYEYRIILDTNEVSIKKAINRADIDMTIEDFFIGIKSYILKTSLFMAPTSIRGNVCKLFKLIETCGFFEMEHLQTFDKFLDSDTQLRLVFGAVEILEYMGISIPEEYNDILYDKEEKYDTDSKTRTLPSFKSIFEFGDLMGKFISTKNEEDFIKYGPVILWWLICNRVPLRPTEFTLTPKDCVYEHDNKYYLRLKRNVGKGEGSRKLVSTSKPINTYEVDVVRIDKSLFDCVNQYNELMDKKYPIRSEYLLDKRAYTDSFGGSPILNKEMFTSNNLKNSIYSFYENIICGRYKRETCTRLEKKEDEKLKIEKRKFRNHIELISPYDLRHVAIINLIMLGAEPMTVMRMARHKNMSVTMGYFDHTYEYGKSYIMTYAGYLKDLKENAVEKLATDESVNPNDLIKERHPNSALMTWNSIKNENSQKTNYRKVDGGICKYLELDMKPCYLVEGNHYKCPYFVSDNIDDVEKEFYKQSKEVAGLIKTIKALVENYNSVVDFSRKYSTAIEEFRNKVSASAKIASNLDKDIMEIILDKVE